MSRQDIFHTELFLTSWWKDQQAGFGTKVAIWTSVLWDFSSLVLIPATCIFYLSWYFLNYANFFSFFFSVHCHVIIYWTSLFHICSHWYRMRMFLCSWKKITRIHTLCQTGVSQRQWEVMKNLILSWFYWLYFLLVYNRTVQMAFLERFKTASVYSFLCHCQQRQSCFGQLLSVWCEDWLTQADGKLLLN